MIAAGMAQSAPLTDRELEIVRLVSRCRIDVALQIMARFQEQARPPRRVKTSVLSVRENEIAQLALLGFRNKRIAEKLSLSEQTVKNHLHNVFNKLNICDRRSLREALQTL